jgi:hypothetical protein
MGRHVTLPRGLCPCNGETIPHFHRAVWPTLRSEVAKNPKEVRLNSLLRARRKRPRGSRAAQKRDELAPSLVELHAIPHDERGHTPQDIEVAAISQPPTRTDLGHPEAQKSRKELRAGRCQRSRPRLGNRSAVEAAKRVVKIEAAESRGSVVPAVHRAERRRLVERLRALQADARECPDGATKAAMVQAREALRLFDGGR